MHFIAIGAFCIFNCSNLVIAAPLINPPSLPLQNNEIVRAKPNIMFLIDDSGSMQFDYLGDEVISETNCKTANSYFSTTCSTSGITTVAPVLDGNNAGDVPFFAFDFNKLYYNPDIVYEPGVNHNGISLGDQSYTSARKTIYGSTTRVNLNNELKEIYYCNKTGASGAELTNKNI